MPRPTAPVKRICYADDITVWTSGVEITELEHKVTTYLTEMSQFLRENSLLISAPKSSVTLFMPDPAQANTRPKIKIADSEIPVVRSPKLLGVYLDTFFSFNKHCVQVANRVSKRNNVLKALAGTNWGQQKETLLMTYKALGRSIANYAAPVWSINASETNIGKIQRAQNEALRIITGSHNRVQIGSPGSTRFYGPVHLRRYWSVPVSTGPYILGRPVKFSNSQDADNLHTIRKRMPIPFQ